MKGEKAFPMNSEDGITLRDYFVAHCPEPISNDRTWEEEAGIRYMFADYMLKERAMEQISKGE
jgi:hypothetical protein